MPKIFERILCTTPLLHFAGFLQKAEKSENTEDLFINLRKKNAYLDRNVNASELDFSMLERLRNAFIAFPTEIPTESKKGDGRKSALEGYPGFFLP